MSYRRPLTTPPPAAAEKPWPRNLTLGDLCRLDATLETGMAALEHDELDLQQRMRRYREFREAHTLVRAELDRRVSMSAVRDTILMLDRNKTAKGAA